MDYLLNREMLRLDEDVVRRKTLPEINERIDKQIERNVGFMATQPRKVINARLEELEHEWDVDRLLARNAAVIALTGTTFGAVFGRGWLIVPLLVTSFLWHHMQKGWCPPLPVLRRMGARTLREIEVEKFALKVLRGDFESVSRSSDPSERTRQALDMVTRAAQGNGSRAA